MRWEGSSFVTAGWYYGCEQRSTTGADVGRMQQRVGWGQRQCGACVMLGAVGSGDMWVEDPREGRSQSSADDQRKRLQQQKRARALERKVKEVLMDEEDRVPPLGAGSLENYLPSRPLKINVDLSHFHARQSQKRGNSSEALRLFRRCVDMDPYDGRGWLGLARLLFLRGEEEASRETFRNAVRYCRSNSHLLQAWGIMEEKAGNISRARRLLHSAIRADQKHAPSWVALGMLEYRRERNSLRAREYLTNATTVDPSNHFAWHNLGLLEWEIGDLEQARKCFQRGIAARPENSVTWHTWGTLEQSEMRFSKARFLYKQAHSVSEKNTHVLLSWAILEEKLGRGKEARSILFKALRTNPSDGALYQALGMIEARQSNWDEARKYFRRGTVSDPKHCPIWQAWGLMEFQLGRIDRARDLFQEGVWANPRSMMVITIWHAWATMEARAGNFKQARELLHYGRKMDPKSPHILVSLALLESQAGNDGTAQDYFEQACVVNPKNTVLWATYAKFERDRGREKEATTVQQRGIMACEVRELDKRLVLGAPQAGDFTGLGQWVSEEDLRPRRSGRGPDASALDAWNV